MGFASVILTGFFFSVLLTFFVRKYAISRSIMDHPDERTSHDISTPRGGGAAFYILWLLFFPVALLNGWLSWQLALTLVPGSIAIGAIGIFDDHYKIRTSVRFLVHISSAIFTVWAGSGFPSMLINGAEVYLGAFGFIFVVLSIAWSINLFNFLDGIDTYASMEGIMVLTSGGFFFLLAGGYDEALLIFFIVASVTGFLVWNIPPAKIFMGDCGSGFLGFIIAVFAYLGEIKYGIPVVLWIITYSVFWFDALVTLIRRFRVGEEWYRPHKKHAYQRLYQSGWGHGRISFFASLLNLVLICLAVIGYYWPTLQALLLVVSIGLMATVYMAIERKNPMYGKMV